MKIAEYQALAMRTSPDGHDRVMNGCMGLIGECGEVMDTLKKWLFQSGEKAPMPREKLQEELGDVLWYCAETCTGMGIDLTHAIEEFAAKSADVVKPSSAVKCVYTMVKFATDMFRLVGLDETDFIRQRQQEQYSGFCAVEIGYIVFLINLFLNRYLDTTLERAMEANIEKLRRRYPEGFDPERSLHREAEK